MTGLTRAQAIQTAIDAEKAAAAFYARLARNTEDIQAQKVLEKLAADELEHEQKLLELAAELGESKLPEVGLKLADGIEIRADWYEVDNITYKQALDIALDGERNAELYYAALAVDTTPEVEAFFQGMSKVERLHANWVSELIAMQS